MPGEVASTTRLPSGLMPPPVVFPSLSKMWATSSVVASTIRSSSGPPVLTETIN